MEVSERMSFCVKEKTNITLILKLLKMYDDKCIPPHKAHLQVLWTKLVAVHVNGRQEDGLHLVVPQFVRW